MRIWGLHKNSLIRIQESGSRCIRIQFGMIRRSGPRPDPESFAFCIFDEFFYGSGPEDPDPGLRHTQQLKKNLKHDFFKENRIRAYL